MRKCHRNFMPHKPYAEIDGGCNITTSLLGLVKLMALVVWLFSFAFYTGEAEEDEIVMEKRLRQKSCYATVYSPLALPLGELSPQVTERVLQPFSMPSPSSLCSATSPSGRGKGYSRGTPEGVRYYYLMRSFRTGCCTAPRRSRRRP